MSSRTALSSDAPVEDSIETCSLLHRMTPLTTQSALCRVAGNFPHQKCKPPGCHGWLSWFVQVQRGQHLKTHCALDLSTGLVVYMQLLVCLYDRAKIYYCM